jgi:hypothetical protein
MGCRAPGQREVTWAGLWFRGKIALRKSDSTPVAGCRDHGPAMPANSGGESPENDGRRMAGAPSWREISNVCIRSLPRELATGTAFPARVQRRDCVKKIRQPPPVEAGSQCGMRHRKTGSSLWVLQPPFASASRRRLRQLTPGGFQPKDNKGRKGPDPRSKRSRWRAIARKPSRAAKSGGAGSELLGNAFLEGEAGVPAIQGV